jgi:hypothetical protein
MVCVKWENGPGENGNDIKMERYIKWKMENG